MRRIYFVFFLFFTCSVANGADGVGDTVDRTTLDGKIMCGYQGWFRCDGDGSDLGWTHWAKNPNKLFGPGNVTVDLWPDMTEYTPKEKFRTGFKYSDGTPASVFSSANRTTVMRHFQWMQDYGIDGAFVQRFASGLRRPGGFSDKNKVLENARDGANHSGRAFAVMYDLSGLKAGETKIVQDDWTALQSALKITDDPAYIRHEGKPVVSVWGVGFAKDRKYTLTESMQLVEWLKSKGCTVMLGTPTYWKDGERDADDDPMLKQIIKAADIISPWSVGRYGSPKNATKHAATHWSDDQKWCKRHQLDYMPVVFPGFSWHNLKGDPLDSIPRLKGKFLWAQLVGAKRAGCKMIYVAMFDEVDEGTAIFKCTNEPPVGEGTKSITFEGLPSDHYLKIAGAGGRLLRDEIRATDKLPSLDVPTVRSSPLIELTDMQGNVIRVTIIAVKENAVSFDLNGKTYEYSFKQLDAKSRKKLRSLRVVGKR